MDTVLNPILRPTVAEHTERCVRCRQLVRVGEECYERYGRVGYVCADCRVPPAPKPLSRDTDA